MLSIPFQTLLISVIMGIACCLPRTVQGVQKYSRVLLLIGTGGLVSLLIWDLIPDAWEIGGPKSLCVIALAWGAYTLAHIRSHRKDHDHDSPHGHSCEHLSGASSTRFLMLSMMLHCLTSGILLALAQEFSSKIAFTFFLAMLAHKGYEAFSVSLVLHQRLKSNRDFMIYALSYAVSFPVGVLATIVCTSLLGAQVGPMMMKGFAMMAASVAIGSLIGCIIHHFVLPAYQQVREKSFEWGWIALGVILTLVFS